MKSSTMLSILFVFTLLCMAALFGLAICKNEPGALVIGAVIGIPCLIVLVAVRADQERGL